MNRSRKIFRKTKRYHKYKRVIVNYYFSVEWDPKAETMKNVTFSLKLNEGRPLLVAGCKIQATGNGTLSVRLYDLHGEGVDYPSQISQPIQLGIHPFVTFAVVPKTFLRCFQLYILYYLRTL